MRPLIAVALLLAACKGDKAPDDDPKKASKVSEPELNLRAIEKAAKVFYVESGAFPGGTAALAPPTPCCDSARADRKCEPDAEQWRGTVWEQLDFTIDEAHYFQYGYQGSAEGFTATAVGDLDCDGTTVTYTLTGRSAEGTPVTELTKPSNSD